MPKLGAVYLFNHSNCSHQKWQSSILQCVSYRFHLFYHLLSLIVICCHSLSFVVTRCHSLTFVVPLIVIFVTRCYSLSLVVPLVVTRCITSLSFYKRLIQSIKFATTYSLKIDVHKSQKCKRENL